MSDTTIPREQGATRAARPSDFRRAHLDWGAPRRTTPANTDQFREIRLRGLSPQAEPLPRAGARQFGRAGSRVAGRVAARAAAGGLAGQLARITPWGRVFTLAELLALGLWEYSQLSPSYTGPGGDPVPVGYPSRDDMIANGWTVDANWPPPIAATYDRVYQFRLNTTTGISNHSDPNAAGGTVLPWGDFSSVGTYQGITPVVAGDRSPIDDWPLELGFMTQGLGYKTSTSATDPWTYTEGGVAQPVRWGGIGLAITIMPNPNVMRDAVSEPKLDTDLDLEAEMAPSRAMEISPDGVFEVPPGLRQPPKLREIEKKHVSKNGRLMAGVFGALDTISELAEIVDVFYDAIPKEQRRAYEKELGFHWAKNKQGQWRWMKPRSLERGMLDKAGQYGIDGADWKAEGLRRYWKELDTEQAFLGLINNQTQDFVYGQVYRGMGNVAGRRAGHAFDPAFKKIEDGLFEYIYR